MTSVRSFGALMCVLLATGPTQGQIWQRLTNPRVTIELQHPPYSHLRVKTVAFTKPEGECGDSMFSRLESDFINSGVEVVDRQHFDAVLAEHKFQVSGLVDQKTAVDVGALVGAQALIMVRMLQCDTSQRTQRFQDRKGNVRYEYFTDAAINGTIRTIDLTTGKVLAAQPFDDKESEGSWSGYPDRKNMIFEAEDSATSKIHRMFFPWTENRTFIFFDDKECDLKLAFQLVKATDLEGGLKQSDANLDACRGMSEVKPKVLAHAYYNVGMAHFLLNQFDDALPNFMEAEKLQGGSIVTEAMKECQEAKRLDEAMSRYETDEAGVRAELGGRDSSAPAQPEASSSGTVGGAPTSRQTNGKSVEARLKSLKDLLKKGLITQKEYDKKKAEILKDL